MTNDSTAALGVAAVGDGPNGSGWWRQAVFYQVYIRSFADGNGDGIGDLDGLRERLPYLKLLGVDGLWITPFFRSPMADHGYDVSDPRDVDPSFGDLDAFDTMIHEAHRLGLKVTIDVVPNHSSDQHPWFRAAMYADPGSPERDRYIFRDPVDGGPPNNWPSLFGGPAWTRTPDGQYYLHLFAPEQPDLNWAHPQVGADLVRTLRFWLERGVDGFRVDVAHGMAKPADLPDLPAIDADGTVPEGQPDYRTDADGVHDIHRLIRTTIDDYADKVVVGEGCVPPERLGPYLRPDELHLAYNFRLLEADWDAAQIRDAVEVSIATVAAHSAPSCWVLSNHDVSRHRSRYGGDRVGERRARAAALLQLGLPGSVFVYQGDELGLEDVDLPDEALQDPTWERSGHTVRGRDRCRVPMPWSGTGPSYGFSAGDAPWLPMPSDWATVTVDAQLDSPMSHLSLYRNALRLRRTHSAFGDEALTWLAGPEAALAFHRSAGLYVVLNLGSQPLRLPPGELLLTSNDLVDGLLPTDTCAWVQGPAFDGWAEDDE